MKTVTLSIAIAVATVAAPATQPAAQVQTNVPEVVPGAKPVAVERIKGTARHSKATPYDRLPLACTSQPPAQCAAGLHTSQTLVERHRFRVVWSAADMQSRLK